MANNAENPGKVASYDLAMIPTGVVLCGVTAEPAAISGRPALKVQLTDAVSRGAMGVDFGDEPTFVLLPTPILNGSIEFDVLGRLTPMAPAFARAFIGLAYRVQGAGESYESVYLRPLNGKALNPEPPRDQRAVQYYAYPNWKFDRLRTEYPDGRFEVGADIAPDEWIHLRLEIDGPRLTVLVNEVQVISLTENKAEPAIGKIGLWVDIGTEGYFSNLMVTQR